MTSIANPTEWSDFDWLEFEGFVSKVENEGFAYAAENYPPRFESSELQALTAEFGSLRRLYRENEAKVDAWYSQVGPERACDIHNAHVDEARQRREDARLFGIRCTDDFVLTFDSESNRDRQAAYLLENVGKGWRVPQTLLRRDVPGGAWTDERPATA
ncbi:hypothetical protein [Streptomyces sp. NPDC014793]|uniref:hypothetical protein n=1 Tax=Streptomyces sp. NPDC014793 TaxID=3364914 RepID=UPI0036FED5F3